MDHNSNLVMVHAAVINIDQKQTESVIIMMR